MKLFTKAIREKLLANGRQQALVRGTKQEEDFTPVCKLFYPAGAATWLLTEIDPDDENIAFGLADLGMGCPEIGSIYLPELTAFRGRFGLGIERDKWFKGEKPLSQYLAEARSVGHITA